MAIGVDDRVVQSLPEFADLLSRVRAPHVGGPWFGAVLREDNGGMAVIGLMDDAPMAAAGVLVGDIVREIDGQPTLSHENIAAVLVGYAWVTS